MTASFRFSKTRQNGPFLALFNELLSTQNVNVARFARNVEWDFFYDFQTPCKIGDLKLYVVGNMKKNWEFAKLSCFCSILCHCVIRLIFGVIWLPGEDQMRQFALELPNFPSVIICSGMCTIDITLWNVVRSVTSISQSNYKLLTLVSRLCLNFHS